MSLETDFRALLVGDPALLGLVSTRVYLSTYAQATVSPALRYMKVTGGTGLHMGGSDGLSESTMQVDARSSLSAAEAISIRDAIVARLHGYRGIEGATDFRLIELTSDRGVSFDDTGTTKYYVASLDFDVWSRVAT
jgi:hypothetical protein